MQQLFVKSSQIQKLHLRSFLFGAALTAIIFGLISWKVYLAQPFAAVSADKMNVLYIGVDNPISAITTNGAVDKDSISLSDGTLTGDQGKFNAIVSKSGSCTITVKYNGIKQDFPFRVKRTPDPVPVLGAGPNKKGGIMPLAEFKAQRGVAAILENFDFDARCSVISYDIVRVTKDSSPAIVNNIGAPFTNEGKELIMLSNPGDTYYFNEIQARCPGDIANRTLGSMVFAIR